ncbi:MAG: murein biosynthesis integral membrane protein MurJ [Alphaproteobacteria bacterium]|nr:murein biosynthesis integral membrane protein MurJ [Alphaproteobacteria bacterium]
MILMRAVATVGGYTMLSRLLGFARDMLIAAALGAGPVADAFFVAFRIPNLLRRLFAEGAFSAVFVPVFAGRLEVAGPAAARALAEQALAILLAALAAVILVAATAMPWIMLGLAPGFAREPAKFALAVELTRITFPYILFISLVSLFGAVLNSAGRFAAMAAMPIVLNLVMIGVLLFLVGRFATGGHALAWAVAVGGVLQFLWMAVAAERAGFELRLVRPRLTPELSQMLRLLLPATLGVGVAQINLMVDMVIASFLPEGSISFLYYADRVTQLPLGVVGVAVGTALLPLLARQVCAGDAAGAAWNQNRALEFTLLLTLPATVALVVIAEPIISVLFGRGAFGPGAVAATAGALAAYALGLPAYVLIKVLTPGFFARLDTATPVKVAAVALCTNLVLNLALMVPLRHVGIALATAASAWLNVVLLAVLLHRRGHLALDQRLRQRVPRILAACLGLGLALGAGGLALRHGGALSGALALALLIGGGGALYLGLVALLGAASRRDLAQLRRTPPPAA